MTLRVIVYETAEVGVLAKELHIFAGDIPYIRLHSHQLIQVQLQLAQLFIIE